MESCGRYIVLVMTFEVATHFLKCISCSITPQTPSSTGKISEPAPQRGRPRKEEPAGSKPYSVILPIQDVEALKRVSKKTGESVSVLIRAAIREYLNASNGGLSVRQIAEIKELVPQGMQKSVRSTLT